MRLDDDKDEDEFTNYYGGNRKFVREGVEGKQKLDGKLEAYLFSQSINGELVNNYLVYNNIQNVLFLKSHLESV